MGANCCYFEKVNLLEDEKVVGKSLLIEVINIKFPEQVIISDPDSTDRYDNIFNSSTSSI